MRGFVTLSALIFQFCTSCNGILIDEFRMIFVSDLLSAVCVGKESEGRKRGRSWGFCCTTLARAYFKIGQMAEVAVIFFSICDAIGGKSIVKTDTVTVKAG